jgi:hypothetical protein
VLTRPSSGLGLLHNAGISYGRELALCVVACVQLQYSAALLALCVVVRVQIFSSTTR